VAIAVLSLGAWVSHPNVNYVATIPGFYGIPLAFAAEVAMAFLMMSMILEVTNQARLARFTGIFAGILVFAFITLEAPISGMSINPARTFGSALNARLWTALWLYFLAPPLGMALAAEVHRRSSHATVRCAKLHHDNDERCIFRCGYREQALPATAAAPSPSASRKCLLSKKTAAGVMRRVTTGSDGSAAPAEYAAPGARDGAGL
jgi:aquaporin Z